MRPAAAIRTLEHVVELQQCSLSVQWQGQQKGAQWHSNCSVLVCVLVVAAAVKVVQKQLCNEGHSLLPGIIVCMCCCCLLHRHDRTVGFCFDCHHMRTESHMFILSVALFALLVTRTLPRMLLPTSARPRSSMTAWQLRWCSTDTYATSSHAHWTT